MGVNEIHAGLGNRGGWVIFIEGVRPAFTNIEALVGSGVGSWIGTSFGDREVLPGLRMPSELGLGETDPFTGKLEQPAPVSFQFLDFDGDVVALFREHEPDLTTDTLGDRLSPLDDPAPATIPGPNQTPVDLWGRAIGLETFGPAGERRYFWIEPSGAPPGLDHVGGAGWPPAVITDQPTQWPGRRIAVYRIVYDKAAGVWPDWADQHAGGSLWWCGKIKGRGTFRSTGSERIFSLPCNGQASWLRAPANLLRPTKWHQPQGGVVLEGDRAKVAAWIEVLPYHQVGDGIASIPGVWKAQTLGSGSTFAGLTTREEIAAYLDDVIQTMITDLDHGTVLAATNKSWTEPDPIASANWGAGGDGTRAVSISADGSVITITSESPTTPNANRGYNVGIAMDATAWALFGWDIDSQLLQREENLPVGGQHWGELQGDQVTPPYHYVGIFSTRESVDQSSALWANGGQPKSYQAPYQSGTVTLDHEGGDVVRLAVGVARVEGQLAQAYTIGAQIDGVDVDAAGWWLFAGDRLTAAGFIAGDDPEPDIQVARCEWVSTSSGDGVEVDSSGYSRLRILEWENPKRFGLPYEQLREPWASVVGQLQAAPLGVIGGTIKGPDWRHRLIPRVLLSSGTAVFAEAGGVVTITPGANHPGDLPPGDPWSGDVEVADLGLGLTSAFVDWASWWTTCAALPGGTAGASNRVVYGLFGSERIEHILAEAMAGRGLAWSLKRKLGGVVPAFGCFDPVADLTLEDVEVTLLRENLAEVTLSEDQQWRGTVELRDGGPYDRFVYDVDGDPFEPGSSNYRQAHESEDPGRRFRDGTIDWDVKDRGLRDPAPWLGTGKQALYDWLPDARVRFARNIGQRYAKSARIYKGVYDATLAGRIGLGTIVHVVDSTAESPDGVRGINHLGWVREAAILSRGAGAGSVRVSVELQPRPVDALKVWAPQARAGVDSWDQGSSTLTVREDWALVGDGHEDTLGFVQPDWSTLAAGPLRVAVYQSEVGRLFPASFDVRADIASVDPLLHTITLSNVVGTIYRDTIKVIVAAHKDEQTAAWALALFVPVTEPSGLWDGVENGDRL